MIMFKQIHKITKNPLYDTRQVDCKWFKAKLFDSFDSCSFHHIFIYLSFLYVFLSNYPTIYCIYYSSYLSISSYIYTYLLISIYLNINLYLFVYHSGYDDNVDIILMIINISIFHFHAMEANLHYKLYLILTDDFPNHAFGTQSNCLIFY